jgi:hypothetical protein
MSITTLNSTTGLDVQAAPVVQAVSNLDGTGAAWLDCPVCELDGGPYGLDEAGQLAGLHDDLRHRGHPTVTVVVPAAGVAV